MAESEEKYRRLFEHMREGLAHCRMIFENGQPVDFIYLDVNPAFETLTGLLDVTGRRVTEVIPGIRESDPELFAIYGRVASTGVPERFETFVGALGMWFSVSVFSPEPECFVAVFDVITERKESEKALRETTEELDQFFSLSLDLLAIGDTDGRIRRANPAWEKVLGYTQGELEGGRYFDLIHPDDMQTAMNDAAQLARQEELVDSAGRFRAKDGSYRWIEFRCSARGKRIYAAARDITERKRSEDERETMLRLLRLLNGPNNQHELIREVTAMLQGWSGCDAVGVRLKAGDDFPYFETRGFSAEFVEAENSLCSRDRAGDLLCDRNGNPVLECMCGNILAGRFNPEKPFFTANGSFWTNCTTRLLASTTEADRQARTRNRCNGEGYESVALIPLRAGGQTLGLLQFNARSEGRFSPETIALLERAAASIAIALEQRQTLAALRKSQERYRLVADHTYDWEFWVGPDGTPLYHSPSCERITGYAAAEFMADPGLLERIAHPDDVARLRQHLRDPGRGPGSLEFRIVAKRGAEVVIEHVCQPVYGDAGEYLGERGSHRDITERTNAERERAHLAEQLQQAQKLESVGRLAGGVAHDFNNLLTVINGYSAMALAELDPLDSLYSELAEIQKAGERAADLTRQLLTFSRKQVVQLKPLDLNQLISDSSDMLERLIGEDTELVTSLDPALEFVLADAGQLHQVIVNLAVNARDAMPNGGQVTVKTANRELGSDFTAAHPGAEAGTYVVLSFADTGIGMSPETLKRIFEPFFTTKGEGSGTGLGLATVYGIVRQCGGWITVESEPDRGAVFTIGLPRTSAPPTGEPQAVVSAGATRGSETILVVEDQPDVRGLAVLALRRHGYRVLEACNGEDALAAVEQHPEKIHLMLTDVVMPGMSGKELAEHMSRLRPDMCVLFMSGYSADVILTRGLSNAEVDYIRKPFAPSALAAKVQSVLGAARSLSRILVVDDQAAVRKFFAGVLTGAGYEVSEAGDGDEALEALGQAAVELVITDLVMPNREGIETIREIRKRFPSVRIIAVSGAFGGDFLKVAKLVGASAALMKPVSPEQLLEEVRRVLS